MAELIFTKHALQRLDERAFSRAMVESAIGSPDRVQAGKEPNTREYMKRFDTQTVTAILGKGSKGEDLVLSCWIDPPVYGTYDHHKHLKYRKYKRAGFWGKVVMDILRSFGL